MRPSFALEDDFKADEGIHLENTDTIDPAVTGTSGDFNLLEA